MLTTVDRREKKRRFRLDGERHKLKGEVGQNQTSESLPIATAIVFMSDEDGAGNIYYTLFAQIIENKPGTMCNAFVIMVEHARSIVEDEAIYLTNRHNYLQRMAQWMIYDNKSRQNKAQGPPCKLA